MPDGAGDLSPINEIALDASCPMCGEAPLRMRSMALDIPYFGDALQTTLLCGACGFRHGDVLLTRQGDPTRASLKIRRPGDLNARVVRSSSCTVRIPEAGAIMEPGPQSESFISNVEGVLRRFRDIIGFLARNADTRARRAAATKSIATVERMIEGRERFTIVLEDPFGNSAILHEDSEVRPLTAREIRSLKTGVFTMKVRPGGRRSPGSP